MARSASTAAPSEIRLDCATYNPLSLVLKDKGLLEKDRQGRHHGALGADARLQQGAGVPQRRLDRFRLHRRRRRADRADQRQSDQGGLCLFAAGMDGARHRARTAGITKVADLKGKRVAVTRGTDPHIFLVRALHGAGLTEKDIKLVLLQHPDGSTALDRGDVDAWAGLDPMMAAAEIENGAVLFFRNAGGQHLGRARRARGICRGNHPDLVER